MNFKDISVKYFSTFSNKNIDGLREMFDSTVRLRDWNISAVGIEEVIDANQKIFDSVQTINVDAVSIYQDGNTVIAELVIQVNEVTTVLVTDIIEFNDDGKITNIRAYQG